MASTGASRRRESVLLEQHRKLRSARGVLEHSPLLVSNGHNNNDNDFNERDALLTPTRMAQRRHSSGGTHHVDDKEMHHIGGATYAEPRYGHPNDNPAHHNHLDLMDYGRTRRTRQSFVDPDAHRKSPNVLRTGAAPPPSPTRGTDYGALLQALDLNQKNGGQDDASEDNLDDEHDHDNNFRTKRLLRGNKPRHPCPAHGPVQALKKGLKEIVEQLPAIIATLLLILMVAVPFGVAYFPIQWSNHPSSVDTNDDDDLPGGTFPLPGKDSLGIRMALFATLTGQLVMTFASQFDNPVSFQLLENVPFYRALAHTVLQEQGYGPEALATLFFLFGLSSVLVGVVFYTLGKCQWGRVAYFFPAHVLVGCIGGIGVFIIMTSIEVTNNQDFSFDMDGLRGLWDHWHLFSLVILLEVVLRVLSAIFVDEHGHPKYRYLAPIYFCSIVPLFYLGLYLCGVSTEQAKDMGYLFPDPACEGGDDDDCGSMSFHDKVFNGHVLDLFRIIDFRLISWTAVRKSLGTLAALCSFSLIHVPINIPAFAVSSNVDVDMNNELMAHGYSNFLSGLFGGLQNVMTYSFSVLYQKSGGGGIPSCLALTAGIALLFIYGPAVAVYFPRCMAGTLLLHIGLDLFLEGCYDSYGNFDALEYAGIWCITIVMSVFGMTAALLAGILSALSTYAVQSITHLDPIFRIMHATTLRSSAWVRPSDAMAILDNTRTGRARVLVVQLQGHLFFGNTGDLADTIKKMLTEKLGTDEQPLIVVMDFTLVVGMDSSAAHAIAKLKGLMHKLYQVEVSIFVTGTHREGFPCEYALSDALSAREPHDDACVVDYNDVQANSPDPSRARRGSVGVAPESEAFKAVQVVRDFPKNRVCNSLDEGLVFAEDILVARQNPSLLLNPAQTLADDPQYNEDETISQQDERALAESFMEQILPMTVTPEVKHSIQSFVARCVREEYTQGDVLWKEGDESDSAKILVLGSVCATLEGTKVCENVARGNIFGELGLVDGTRRLSTVTCTSPKVVMYSMPKAIFDEMVETNQREARLLERIAIRYLAHRVQHVSNRIMETHCLPI